MARSTGQKLKKTSNIDGITDYVAGIHYKNSVIDFIQTEEGLARNNSGNYSYEYNLTDHLGNVRYTFNQHPTTGAIQTLQIDNYYAFGLRKSATGGTNKYLYNGKELQEELGQYDYGARFYDPVIPRFVTIDPIAEKHYDVNAYAYVMNNPLKFIDPLGLDTVPVNKVDFKKFNTKSDVIALDEVTITAAKSKGVEEKISDFWNGSFRPF